jgi:hypothetical protein
MIKTRKTVKIDKPQNIPKEAIDKYFVANTAEIFVPDKVVSIDDEGKIKLVKTLTKKKNIKNIKGKPVIKFDDKNIKDIVINNKGEKLIDKSRSVLNMILKKPEKLVGQSEGEKIYYKARDEYINLLQLKRKEPGLFAQNNQKNKYTRRVGELEKIIQLNKPKNVGGFSI